MTLSVSFSEIQKYFAIRYGRNINITKIDSHTFSVGVSVKALLATLTVSAAVTIEGIEENVLTLRYKGSMGLEMILSGVIAFLKSQIKNFDEAVKSNAQSVMIDLCVLDQTRSLTEYIIIEDIIIKDDCFAIKGSLKFIQHD